MPVSASSGGITESTRSQGDALPLRELPSAVEHFGIFTVAAGEPCHERTFGGHATAVGADLLEHTFGKLRAAPLSREFLLHLGVEEDDPAILDPIVGNSYGAADRKLEPFRSRIINDACIPVVLPPIRVRQEFS